MRLKKPTRVSIEQVRITRDGNNAMVDHADADISGAHLAIGPEIAAMTDAKIVDLYNDILESQHRLPAEWDKTVIEDDVLGCLKDAIPNLNRSALKALKWRTPYQVICKAWTKDPSIFKVNPRHLIPGPHT
jgi:hypothetical protein